MTDTPAPRPPLPLLLLGALSIALGVAALAWPQATLLTLALLFGVHLVLVGGLRLWVAWRGHELPRALQPVPSPARHRSGCQGCTSEPR